MSRTDIKERFVRVLIFIILSFIIIRCLLGLDLSDFNQIKIVLGMTVCFMFVNTYYPNIVTKK